MKRNLPGAFTFILNGTTRLPKIFRNRKEVGIRMPDNAIIRGNSPYSGRSHHDYHSPARSARRYRILH